jgi:hypothetical protein
VRLSRLLLIIWFAISVDAAETRVYKDHAFTEFFRRTNGIVACDGAFSVPLSDGRVLWLFGDSYVDCYSPDRVGIPCLFQVRNAGMLHQRDDLRNPDQSGLIGKHAGIKSLFKNATNEDTWFWPVSGFQHDKAVYIYLTHLKKAGSGPLGFATTGQDFLARMKFPELDDISYLPLPFARPEGHGIDFGAGFVSEPGPYTYAFGHKRRGISVSLYLARFASANPDSNWTFWTGTAWSANVGNAASIATQDATSITACKVKDKFVLTSSEFSIACDQGKSIYMSVSDNPAGPYSARKKIYTIDDTFQGHHPFFYLPVAHPEFINPNGDLLLTYCINGYEPCVRSCIEGRMDPDHYRPRAIRVPLELILNESKKN